jgi:uncharacterized protein (TIGR04551 family)
MPSTLRNAPSSSSRLACIAALLLGPTALLAASFPAAARAQSAPPSVSEEEEEYEEEEEPVQLRRPTAEPIDLEPATAGTPDDAEADEEDAEADAPEEEAEEALPAAADSRLGNVSSDPTAEPWTTPQTVFEVHGYMRVRGEFQDQYSLGRTSTAPAGGGGLRDPYSDAPFSLFIPREDGSSPGGGCAGASGGDMTACNQRALAFANMRLRLEPTIHLSDDVRIRMQVDLLDNVVMGSTPEGYNFDLATGRRGSSYVPVTAFAQTQDPPSAGVNSWTDSIRVRRAWAEVRNRGLGELRFGRMGNHWGLGILANGGSGIDSDYQSDVDRIMAITRLVGFYIFAAWDFASEGFIANDQNNTRVPWDAFRNDDVDQFTFGVARRATPEEQTMALARGDFVLNAGLYFVYRTQNLSTERLAPLESSLGANRNSAVFRRGFEVYTPDVWVQFLYDKLRLEVEAAMMIGTIDNVALGSSNILGTNRILSFGAAFEGEYRLLHDQLGIYFYTGVGTGDADVHGLSNSTTSNDLQRNRIGGRDTNLTAFSFHPNYRIDMIFWRTIMRQFGSAYYFKPGVSYDFIRTPFGQLLGARADVIWSRATEPVQTWGNQPDIGVEIDAQAYYRSEDGPDLLDGFYASAQFGVFFPLGALAPGPDTTVAGGGQNAFNLRLILGVQY